MKKTEKSQRNFVAYEYKEVSANSSQASFLLDGYENFGWEPDDNLPQSSQSRHPDIKSDNMGAGSRSDRNCIYCMFYVCGDSRSAENPFVYYFCDSRISGMDPAVFPL